MKMIYSAYIWLFLGCVFLFSSETFFDIRPGFRHLFFMLGTMSLCESLLRGVFSKSFFLKFNSSSKVAKLFLTCWVGGFLMDGTIQWLGNFWIYPGWTFSHYLLMSTFGWVVYFVTLLMVFYVFKNVFDACIPVFSYSKKSFSRRLYKIFPTVSLLILVYLTLHTLINVNLINHSISDPNPSVFGIWHVVLAFICIYTSFETWSHSLRTNNITSGPLVGYMSVLLAFIVSSFVFAWLVETHNLPTGTWRYVNIPFSEYTFLNFPVVMWLGWPLHQVAIIAIFRALMPKTSSFLTEIPKKLAN